MLRFLERESVAWCVRETREWGVAIVLGPKRAHAGVALKGDVPCHLGQELPVRTGSSDGHHVSTRRTVRPRTSSIGRNTVFQGEPPPPRALSVLSYAQIGQG